MKDPNDTSTIDALETPRRGRPKSGNALSNAEKQRLYRERVKAAKQRQRMTQGALKPVDMTTSELCHVIQALKEYSVTMGPANEHHRQMHDALLARLIAEYPKHAKAPK